MLRERDEQFRAVFDNALDALLVVDDERRLVDANPAARTMLKVSSDAPAAPLPLKRSSTRHRRRGLRSDGPQACESRQDKGELISPGGRRKTHR